MSYQFQVNSRAHTISLSHSNLNYKKKELNLSAPVLVYFYEVIGIILFIFRQGHGRHEAKESSSIKRRAKTPPIYNCHFCLTIQLNFYIASE